METEAHNGFMTCSMLHSQLCWDYVEVGPQIGALQRLGQGHAPRWDTEGVFSRVLTISYVCLPWLNTDGF